MTREEWAEELANAWTIRERAKQQAVTFSRDRLDEAVADMDRARGAAQLTYETTKRLEEARYNHKILMIEDTYARKLAEIAYDSTVAAVKEANNA